jgi:hypothetical protein
MNSSCYEVHACSASRQILGIYHVNIEGGVHGESFHILIHFDRCNEFRAAWEYLMKITLTTKCAHDKK